MISQAQEEYILRQAYVPEHVPNLMVGVSKGEPYLIGDYVIFAKDDWLIFVGYPLNRDCRPEIFATALKETIKKFNPTYTWFVAPEIPNSILQSPRQREGDEYYKLEMRNHEVEKGLMRIVKKASEALTIEKSRQFSEEHVTLTRDFLEKESPPLRVKELFSQMPGFVLFEGPLDDQSRNRVVAQSLKAEEATTLYEALDGQTIRKIRKLMGHLFRKSDSLSLILPFTSRGQDPLWVHFQSRSPWMAFFQIWSNFLKERGWKHSVDLEAWQIATQLGKEIIFLETIEEQISFLMPAMPRGIWLLLISPNSAAGIMPFTCSISDPGNTMYPGRQTFSSMP